MEGVAANGWAPSQLTWAELDAWARRTGTELRPWEARALVRLSGLRAEIIAAKQESEGQRPGST